MRWDWGALRSQEETLRVGGEGLRWRGSKWSLLEDRLLAWRQRRRQLASTVSIRQRSSPLLLTEGLLITSS